MAVSAAWGYELPIDPEGAQDPKLLTNNHKPSMTQDFEHAPFVRGRFVTQNVFRQGQYCGRDFFRALLGGVEVLLEIEFSHGEICNL